MHEAFTSLTSPLLEKGTWVIAHYFGANVKAKIDTSLDFKTDGYTLKTFGYQKSIFELREFCTEWTDGIWCETFLNIILETGMPVEKAVVEVLEYYDSNPGIAAQHPDAVKHAKEWFTRL